MYQIMDFDIELASYIWEFLEYENLEKVVFEIDKDGGYEFREYEEGDDTAIYLSPIMCEGKPGAELKKALQFTYLYHLAEKKINEWINNEKGDEE